MQKKKENRKWRDNTRQPSGYATELFRKVKVKSSLEMEKSRFEMKKKRG